MIALLALSSLGLCLFMLAGWAYQRHVGNGGWTDVFWTFGVGAASAAVALAPLGPGQPSERQVLVAGLAAIWSLRLGLHIAVRVAHSPEDARYTGLRQQWGAAFQSRMAVFLPSQGLVSIPLLTAMMLAARNPAPDLRPADLLGALALLIAVLGEGAADRQLELFKSDPANKGGVCDVGLWRYSRHPNYFFEWFGWLAYPIIAIDPSGAYPWGWLALAGPAAMYAILNFATGIPPLEAHMLRVRGEAFRDYQRRTSAFFPLPPRS